MIEFISTVPVWVWVVIIIGIILVAVRGISFSYKDVKIDTKHKQPVSTPQEISIPISHLIQFRKLRTDIKDDILVSKGEFLALFRSLFINHLKHLGWDHNGIELCEEVKQYEGYLKQALDTVFDPMIKKVIFGNHFPMRKVDESGKYCESEKEYEARFFTKLTMPTTFTILRMTKNEVSSSWRIKSINRGEYEKNDVMNKATTDNILSKMSDLIIKCRERRDHVLEQIMNQDETNIEMLKFEWEMVYG